MYLENISYKNIFYEPCCYNFEKVCGMRIGFKDMDTNIPVVLNFCPFCGKKVIRNKFWAKEKEIIKEVDG